MTQKKEVTIYDLAEALNLSPSTVSRGLRKHPAIKPETVHRIQQKARELNYQQNTFASSLRRNRSNAIGVVLPRLDSHFQAAVVSGIEQVVASKGYRLLISQSCESNRIEKEVIQTLYDSRVDGMLISLAADTSRLDHLATFMQKETPVVLFDRTLDHPDCKCTTVVIDNEQAGYDVTRHLVEQGFRRIAYLGDNDVCRVFDDRKRGYIRALREAGLPVQEDRILTDRLNEAAGERTVSRLLRLDPKPDAVFAANDVSAAAIMMALKQRGISIPGDMAVAGFNNVQVSRVVDPPLTTVNYPGVEMGRIAASSLLGLMDEGSQVATQTIVLKHELIVRGSTIFQPREIHLS